MKRGSNGNVANRALRALACALLLAAIPIGAGAYTVSVCGESGVADGAPNAACNSLWTTKYIWAVTASELVLICRGADLALGIYTDSSCEPAGGSFVVALPLSIGASDFVYGGADGNNGIAPAGGFTVPTGFVTGGGGGGGGDEGSTLFPELSVEQAMEIFGAALLLWAVAFAGYLLRKTLEKGGSP